MGRRTCDLHIYGLVMACAQWEGALKDHGSNSSRIPTPMRKPPENDADAPHLDVRILLVAALLVLPQRIQRCIDRSGSGRYARAPRATPHDQSFCRFSESASPSFLSGYVFWSVLFVDTRTGRSLPHHNMTADSCGFLISLISCPNQIHK